ncbi:hypothetical protein TMPK1_29380 [Rhodospirillales bacterium TMPK1]|uniref:Uncharacterized protein n=2 Tax=Roseiterribacter gracilis TaxID=2812848 RepID=A0A8S8XFG3_9PROT|nr:hypothetical protein TMPK1_29380 [Rhodospirillales bacterium TMPK1]
MRRLKWLYFVFVLQGLFIAAMLSLPYEKNLFRKEFELQNFQSLFQLAVALNLALASFASFLPGNAEQQRERLLEADDAFAAIVSETEREMRELERNAMDEAALHGTDDFTIYINPKHRELEDRMVSAAQGASDAFDAYRDSFRTRLESTLEEWQTGIAFLSGGVAFLTLIGCTLFTKAGLIGAFALQLIFGALAGFCYMPILITGFAILLAFRRSKDLEVAIRRFERQIQGIP